MKLEYQLAWARTHLKNYGVIVNSAISVWSITSDYTIEVELNPTKIVAYTANKNAKKRLEKSETSVATDGTIKNCSLKK